MQSIIDVQNLRKTYGDTIAVDDVSFAVEKGEIFGILGPNGAGKTTTVECIIGLREPDRGHVRVLGHDPQKERLSVVPRIGIQLQQAQLPDRIKVWEALDLYSSFYAQTVPWEPLLERWGLAEKRNAVFRNLSGGQKQRLFIALALLNDPEVVFLDELTTGLDPQARRNTWDLIRDIRAEGKTVVLVTHFMDEAELLCDRVAVIDRGRVVALDVPQALINQLEAATRITFTTSNGLTADTLRGLTAVRDVKQEDLQITVNGDGNLLLTVATQLAAHNVQPRDLRVTQPTLEDVFIELTGRDLGNDARLP